MSPKEFENEYKRLIAVFPNGFSGIHRKQLISRVVGPLNAKWWVGIVDHIILTNNPKFDIDAAARSERNAARGVKATKEVGEALENFQKNISDAGLENLLKQFNANSLWDAVEYERSKNKKE